MQSVSQVLNAVESQVEAMRNDETEVVGTVSLGDGVRQGDLYLVCVTGKKLKDLKPIDERQLAPGTTQGSRHVAEGNCRIYVGDPDQLGKLVQKILNRDEPIPADLIGPVLFADGDVEITHPDHGNKVLPKDECYVVVYQRAWADEVRRQMD